MNNSPLRSPHAATGGPALNGVRSAALLIDFDNVTMNVRSDLGKELKSLLDSDVFRGKIAVRRAYADWRRYPSSVVPLTEASVDLIFAPAYGTSKKNATDLRMAVDAIELAFMRPEIGVFILLTGDSDFSSCVMKLKEYGKYVIGVGMRESASDLLIQNCDEYYSYHNLSGLTRATDDTGVREDPWALVTRAAQTMSRRGDVMRVDRLKQVMIELDSGFNEKDIGYSKFSKFIQEAQSRGLLRLRRNDQGDWEVRPPVARDDEPAEETQPLDRERGERVERGDRYRDRGRSRGGRDRSRDRGRSRDEQPEDESSSQAPSAPAETPASAEPETKAPAETSAPRRESPSRPAESAPAEAQPAQAAAPESGEPVQVVNALRNAFALLQHTVRGMVRRPGETARDGDVKRRMLDAQPSFDEGPLGFSKFSRFLREAHEQQVVDVRRLDDGGYEVMLPASGGVRLPAPVLSAGAAPAAKAADTAAPASDDAASAAPRGGRGGRGRGRRGEPSGPPPLLPGQVVAGADVDAGTDEAKPAREDKPAEREPEMTPAQARQERDDGEAHVTHREPAVATARLEDPAGIANRGSSTSSGSVGVRGRGGRGRRGGEPSGPPPLLPGQVMTVGGTSAAQPAAEAKQPESKQAEPKQAESKQAESKPSERGPIDAARLGLPTERDGIVQRIASYNFVGRATGEALADAYGAEVWRTLDENPDAVRELLGARKSRPLLEQWGTERDQLIANAPPEEPAAAQAEAVSGDTESTAPAGDAPGEPRGRSRSRRGGRGRGRASSDEAAQAEGAGGADSPAGASGEGTAPSGDDQPSATAQADAAGDDTDSAGDADGGTRGRSRSRRGGRGRGRTRADGDEAPAAEAAPEPTPEPAAEEARPARGRGRGRKAAPADAAPAEEAPAAEPAVEERPAARARSRGGRGRGTAAKSAPEAEAAPAETSEPAKGRGRGGRAAAADATPPADAPEADAASADDGNGARTRSRRRGGRGRSKGSSGGAAE